MLLQHRCIEHINIYVIATVWLFHHQVIMFVMYPILGLVDWKS